MVAADVSTKDWALRAASNYTPTRVRRTCTSAVGADLGVAVIASRGIQAAIFEITVQEV